MVKSVRLLDADNKQLKPVSKLLLWKPPPTPTNDRSCHRCLEFEKKTASMFKKIKSLADRNLMRTIEIHRLSSRNARDLSSLLNYHKTTQEIVSGAEPNGYRQKLTCISDIFKNHRIEMMNW